SSETALRYFEKGGDLQDCIRAQESMQHLEKAVAKDPNFVLEINSGFQAPRRGIATNYILKGEHAKARRFYKNIMTRPLTTARAALFSTTVSYVDEGNLEMALATERKRLEIAQKINDAAAMAGDVGTQANILLEFGRYTDAAEEFEQSLKTMRQPDQSAEQKELAEHGHLFNLSNLNLKEGNLAKAPFRLWPILCSQP
ncbi:hypothetical protein MJD09_23015, partial [bacterium]|nr:hypothetical protein [bacterium]